MLRSDGRLGMPSAAETFARGTRGEEDIRVHGFISLQKVRHARTVSATLRLGWPTLLLRWESYQLKGFLSTHRMYYNDMIGQR